MEKMTFYAKYILSNFSIRSVLQDRLHGNRRERKIQKKDGGDEGSCGAVIGKFSELGRRTYSQPSSNQFEEHDRFPSTITIEFRSKSYRYI
jgi:hypothetical protein